ncbi:MAG: MarR family transcriptional regulator, partial [Scytonema sp. PMC 1069.18]|nr:MarR family transcriptional regulator [Scytonema sp. PMC 1069.18]
MGSEQTSQKTVSEECAARVMETIPLVMKAIRAEMRAVGSTTLSVPQFRTLAFLDRNPGVSLSDLAEHLGVTRATASATIERLVQRDYVARKDHPQERRRVVLNLTEAGTHHLQQARVHTRRYISDLLNYLSEEEVLQIEKGLGLLKQIFERTLDDNKMDGSGSAPSPDGDATRTGKSKV